MDYLESLRDGMQTNQFSSFDVARLMEELENCRRLIREHEKFMRELRDFVGKEEE